MTFISRIAEAVGLMLQRPVRTQYAALCWRRAADGTIEILLLTSRETGRWVIPKGWPMGDKPGHAVARQEAFEEAGMSGTVERAPLGSFGYDKVMAEGVRVPCRVEVHAMEVTGQAEAYKEQALRRIEWVGASEAAARVNEPELKQIILAFAGRMAGSQSA